jgi:Tfp pilus assembly protein PilO
MASNESIFDKLNLSSGERRLVMIVLVVLICALAWMVWGMIPDPGETKKNIAKAQTQLNSFTNETSKTLFYEGKIRELEGMGSAVMPVDQEFTMRRTINNLTAANGVRVTRLGRMTTKTNEFFHEKTMRIDFSSKENDIVKFLWKLGGSDSMVRVSDMLIKPDKNRYRLDGWMNLTASYQKDPKATQAKPAASAKPAAAEAKPEPVAAKPEADSRRGSRGPDGNFGDSRDTPQQPAATQPKPDAGKRTVPKRTIPTRPVRKTQ